MSLFRADLSRCSRSSIGRFCAPFRRDDIFPAPSLRSTTLRARLHRSKFRYNSDGSLSWIDAPPGTLACLGVMADVDFRHIVGVAYERFSELAAAGVVYHFDRCFASAALRPVTPRRASPLFHEPRALAPEDQTLQFEWRQSLLAIPSRDICSEAAR